MQTSDRTAVPAFNAAQTPHCQWLGEPPASLQQRAIQLTANPSDAPVRRPTLALVNLIDTEINFDTLRTQCQTCQPVIAVLTPSQSGLIPALYQSGISDCLFEHEFASAEISSRLQRIQLRHIAQRNAVELPNSTSVGALDGRAQQVLDSLKLGIIVFDRNLHLLHCNHSASLLWNIPHRFAATHPNVDATIRQIFAGQAYEFPAHELDHYIAKRTRLLRKADPQHFEIRHANGNIYHFSVTTLADGGKLLTYYDITELKTTQLNLLSERKKLVEGEERFRKLYNAANRSHKELQLLYKLQAAISNKLDIDDLYETSIHSISEIFGYDIVRVFSLGQNRVTHSTQLSNRQKLHHLSREIVAIIGRTGEPVVRHDLDGDDGARDTRGQPTKARSILGIPLSDSEHTLGVLLIENLSAPLTESDMALMKKVGEQLTMALDNADLLARTTEDLERTRSLSTLSRELNGAPDSSAVYKLAINTSIEIAHADAVAIHLLDDNNALYLYQQTAGYRRYAGFNTDTPLERAAQTHYFVHAINQTESGDRHSGSKRYDVSLCIPLLHQNTLRGILELHRYNRANAFTPAEETLMLGVGDQLSVAAHKQNLLSQIEHQAMHDSLTRLPNRRCFRNHLNDALNQAERSGDLVIVLFIDLDGFKAINDKLGHPVGDRMLIKLADRLHKATRRCDLLARMGGDEFAVVINQLSDPKEAEEIADNYLRLVNHEVRVADHRLFLGASIGISIYPNDSKNPEQLLQHADAAMYQAKSRGKNTACQFSAALAAQNLERLTLEYDLHHALESGQLELHYQPQIDNKTRSIIGVEALVRWHHPEKGLMSPLSFIPIAEETGLILNIGSWVLQHACEQGARWLDAGYTPLRIAVNISALQFARDDFCELVEQTLQATGLPSHLLELEVTESVVMQDIKVVTERLTRLQQLGISIAIDDFGTGYSSLSYLQELPLDALKIDRAFIKSMQADAPTSSLTHSIIMIAKAANLRTIAEGIETVEQLEMVSKLGCAESQGYLISKPQPVDGIETQLTRLPHAALAGG